MRPQETVAEALERLMSILDDEQQTIIAGMREEDAIELHFGLGLAIRNAFRLHAPDSKLKSSLGPLIQADDVSSMIINKLWSRLKYDD